MRQLCGAPRSTTGAGRRRHCGGWSEAEFRHNVSEYAMFAGDIIANEVSHHQQTWVQ